MKYAENLQTPHPLLRDQSQDSQPLLDAIRRDLAEQPDTEKIVTTVQRHVRRTLRYPSREVKIAGNHPTVMDVLKAEQITNCLGYTAVTSECLDEVGVPNLVAYANGHAFNVAVAESNEGAQLRLTDSFSPVLDQDIRGALRLISPASLDALLGNDTKRVVAMLDTSVIAAGKGKTVESLYNNHPWLKGLNKDRSRWSVGAADERYKYLRDNQIAMSLYPSAIGRTVLEDYATFKAKAHNDTDGACDALARLSGLYPDIEARSPHAYIKDLVNTLVRRGQPSRANEAIRLYCGNFVGQDARLLALEGDLYRKVAHTTGDTTAAERMLAAYETARANARYAARTYSGKLAVGQALQARLVNA